MYIYICLKKKYFFKLHTDTNINNSFTCLCTTGFNKKKELFDGISNDKIQERGYIYFMSVWRSRNCAYHFSSTDQNSTRCNDCQKIYNHGNHLRWAKKEKETLLSKQIIITAAHKSTPNKCLSIEQMLEKLHNFAREKRNNKD